MPSPPRSQKKPKAQLFREKAQAFWAWWRSPKRIWHRRVAALFAAIMALPFVMTIFFAGLNPPFTAVGFWSALGGASPKRVWVDYEQISPELVKAVVTSEDSRFCEHAGVDWGAVGDAMGEDGQAVRGASTLTMQVAKNLYLWPSRSYIRKAIEVPLAYWIDLIWSKQRIIEVYLNIVEWGPNVFGAEVAAQHHFKKSAKNISFYQAALLAASLPNPHIRIASKPGPRTKRVSAIIRARMSIIGPYLNCLK